MNGLDEFIDLIEETEAVKGVVKSLKLEPAKLLRDICLEYRETGHPIPDYKLNLVGYLREIALRALISADLIEEKSGGRLSLYVYEPTEKGLDQFVKLEDADFQTYR